MMPCVEGIDRGHVRPLQSNEAFACVMGLALGSVGLATAHLTCQNDVTKVRLPSACCPSRNLFVSVNVAMRKSRWCGFLSAPGRL